MFVGHAPVEDCIFDGVFDHTHLAALSYPKVFMISRPSTGGW